MTGDSVVNSVLADDLKSEIRFFFSEIFKLTPREETITLYLRFHSTYRTDLLRKKQIQVKKIMARDLDLEAIEYFLRFRYPRNVVSSKLWLCAYLCEAQEGAVPASDYQNGIRLNTSPFHCLVILGWFALRSSMKWLKGGMQTYWHRLL
jgi:hypothetical protein